MPPAERQSVPTASQWRAAWEADQARAEVEPPVAANGGPAPGAATAEPPSSTNPPQRGRPDPDEPPALSVSEVTVHFGGVAALTDVNLSVLPGSITGLIGPNGAGKTTLFNVVSGLQPADRGHVRFFGSDMAGLKPHKRARLGVARTFQRLELFGTLTAGENVRVGLESAVKWWQWRHLRSALPWRRGRAGARRAPEVQDEPTGPGSVVVSTADHLLAGVGLAREVHEQSSSLPTGHARMVELARALAIGPRLLLLDEPGSGLDEHEVVALGDLLVRLAGGGMAILLVEHDMELVMRVCDRIHVLDFGQIIASGTPEEIRANPAVQSAYLGGDHAVKGEGATG